MEHLITALLLITLSSSSTDSNHKMDYREAKLELESCRQFPRIIQTLQNSDGDINIFIYAIQRYKKLHQNGLRNQYRFACDYILHQLVKVSEMVLSDDTVHFYDVMELFDEAIEITNPQDLKRYFMETVNTWNLLLHKHAIIHPNHAFVSLLSIHFARNEKDLYQRINSAFKDCKSRIWIYYLAAKKCREFNDCSGDRFTELLIKNMDKSQWRKVTDDVIDEIGQYVGLSQHSLLLISAQKASSTSPYPTEYHRILARQKHSLNVNIESPLAQPMDRSKSQETRETDDISLLISEESGNEDNQDNDLISAPSSIFS